MRRSTLSVTLCYALLVATAPAAAHDAGGLAFRDTHPLTIALSEAAVDTTAAQLVVCNTGRTTARRLRVAQSGFGFRRDGKPVPDSAVLGRPVLGRADGGRTRKLKPGACAMVRMALVSAATIDSGEYGGELVVVSAGQGIARRDVTITGPLDTAVPAESVADTVTLKVVHESGPFHFLVGNDGMDSDVVLEAPPTGKTLDVPDTCAEPAGKATTTCPAIGVVAHDDDTGQVTLAGKPADAKDGIVRLPVHLSGAGAVGDYVGSIDPGLGGVDDDAIKVAVSVTDAWYWALIALLVGCLLVIIPQLWTRHWRPKGVAKDRARALIDGYDAFRGQGSIEPPTKEELTAYAAAVLTAIGHYFKSVVYVDTDSDGYKEIEQSLKLVEDDIDTWQDPDGLRASVAQLRTELDTVQTWLRDRKFAVADPAVAQAAADVLAARTLEVGESTEVMADADAAGALLQRWQLVAKRVLRLQLWWRAIAMGPGTEFQQGKRLSDKDLKRLIRVGTRLAQVKQELLEAPDAAALDDEPLKRRLEAVYEDLAALGGRYHVDQPDANAASEDMSVAWTTLGIPEPAQERLRLPEPAEIAPRSELLKHAKAVDRLPAAPAEIHHNLRWLGDAVTIAVAIAVAIVTALAAIVTGKNFGTVQDYLTVIVIGTAAQTVASGVIPTINSALADRFGTILSAPARAATTAGAETT